MTRRILVHNPKGGVGKTVVVALAAEWFLHRGRTVHLIDADGNHSCQEWLDNNREEGREISTPVDPEVEIVDTKGVPTRGTTRSTTRRLPTRSLIAWSTTPIDLSCVGSRCVAREPWCPTTRRWRSRRDG